jgi:hypothetical protein
MKSPVVTAALATLLAGPVYADCAYPPAPEKVPDGNTATLDDMIAAKKAVTAYDSAIGTYLDCIKQEHQDALAQGGDKLTDKQKDDLNRIETQRHNAAVTQLQTIADRVNEQIRVYKAKNPPKPQ